MKVLKSGPGVHFEGGLGVHNGNGKCEPVHFLKLLKTLPLITSRLGLMLMLLQLLIHAKQNKKYTHTQFDQRHTFKMSEIHISNVSFIKVHNNVTHISQETGGSKRIPHPLFYTCHNYSISLDVGSNPHSYQSVQFSLFFYVRWN